MSSSFHFFDIYNEAPNAIYGNFDELKTLTELDYISQPKPSDKWSSEPRALNKCQCALNLLDLVYVHTKPKVFLCHSLPTNGPYLQHPSMQPYILLCLHRRSQIKILPQT